MLRVQADSQPCLDLRPPWLSSGALPRARAAAAAAGAPRSARDRRRRGLGLFTCLVLLRPRGTYLAHGGLRQRPPLHVQLALDAVAGAQLEQHAAAGRAAQQRLHLRGRQQVRAVEVWPAAPTSLQEAACFGTDGRQIAETHGEVGPRPQPASRMHKETQNPNFSPQGRCRVISAKTRHDLGNRSTYLLLAPSTVGAEMLACCSPISASVSPPRMPASSAGDPASGPSTIQPPPLRPTSHLRQTQQEPSGSVIKYTT